MIVIWHPTVPRINRNIVECKLNIQLFAEGDAGGINRNIVECKYRTNEESGDRGRTGINRNIVECKYSHTTSVNGD